MVAGQKDQTRLENRQFLRCRRHRQLSTFRREIFMTDTATGRTEVDFDPARLQAWLVEAMGIGADGVTIERVGGGQSNPTYFVTADARRMVLRKRPDGTLAPGAHDVGREFRILHALYGTDVPLPEPIAYREDD